MKKIISAILIVTLVVCLCACGSPKSSPIEDFEYEFEDGTAIITGYIGTDLDIVIPNMIEDRPVTVIGSKAFEGYDLKSVVIPEGVVELENEAFDWCECLENITVPDTLQRVGSNAFNETLWENNQPDGVLYINNVVVGYKGELPENVTIKNGTVSIVDHALQDEDSSSYNTYDYEYNGSGYKSIHIPTSVEYIGEKAVGYISYYSRFGGGFTSSDIPQFKIYGKNGSAAEIFANENGFDFIAE